MISICLYFQVHQPYRLRKYSIFDIGNSIEYFDEEKNKFILKKVAQKCYLPTNNLLLDLINQYPQFKVSFSFSGIFLEQLEKYCPGVLESFQRLVDTGNVELLAETYHHSLSFVYSPAEFEEQVSLHGKKIHTLFSRRPKVLRNTELIFNNDLAKKAKEMGYSGILGEGADHVLGWRSPNFIYTPKESDISVLLKNYRLSDDIAFRFSDKEWKEFPLNVEKYTTWLNQVHGDGNCINLFMDYETFGEHQWESSGIFDFLKYLPNEILKNPENEFATPYELVEKYKPIGEIDVPYFVSWADIERDLSAWLGNDLQRSAIESLYNLQDKIVQLGNERILDTWRKLQTSDHFYYMCIKWFNDGDVHKYFNPYDTPYEGYIYFMNALRDLTRRI